MPPKHKFEYAQLPVFKYQTFDRKSLAFTDHPIIPPERITFSSRYADYLGKTNEPEESTSTEVEPNTAESAAEVPPTDTGDKPETGEAVATNNVPAVPESHIVDEAAETTQAETEDHEVKAEVEPEAVEVEPEPTPLVINAEPPPAPAEDSDTAALASSQEKQPSATTIVEEAAPTESVNNHPAEPAVETTSEEVEDVTTDSSSLAEVVEKLQKANAPPEEINDVLEKALSESDSAEASDPDTKDQTTEPALVLEAISEITASDTMVDATSEAVVDHASGKEILIPEEVVEEIKMADNTPEDASEDVAVSNESPEVDTTENRAMEGSPDASTPLDETEQTQSSEKVPEATPQSADEVNLSPHETSAADTELEKPGGQASVIEKPVEEAREAADEIPTSDAVTGDTKPEVAEGFMVPDISQIEDSQTNENVSPEVSKEPDHALPSEEVATATETALEVDNPVEEIIEISHKPSPVVDSIETATVVESTKEGISAPEVVAANVEASPPTFPITEDKEKRRMKKHRHERQFERERQLSIMNGHKVRLDRKTDERGLFVNAYGKAIDKAREEREYRHNTPEYKEKQKKRAERREAEEAGLKKEKNREKDLLKKKEEARKQADTDRRKRKEAEEVERRKRREAEEAARALETEPKSPTKKTRRPSFTESNSAGSSNGSTRPGLLQRMTAGESDVGGRLFVVNPNKIDAVNIPRSHPDESKTKERGTSEHHEHRKHHHHKHHSGSSQHGDEVLDDSPRRHHHHRNRPPSSRHGSHRGDKHVEPPTLGSVFKSIFVK